MQSFPITNKKQFMNKLLKSDLFDLFEVREVILHTAFKMILDGKRNKDYFDIYDDDVINPYLNWGEIKKNIYELLQGHKLPTYFKIILATPPEKTQSLSLDVTTFYLNIQFKDNHILCSTGTSYKSFTPDQSSDAIWDAYTQRFLFEHHFLD